MENATDWLIHFSVWGLVKVLIIFALGLYLVFALVVVRQISLMTKVVCGELNWLIKILGWVHFIFASLTIVLAIVLL